MKPREIKDLTGLKFGRLLVIEPKWVFKKNGSKQKGWLIICISMIL